MECKWCPVQKEIILVKGQWHYWYRAVDRDGQPGDCLLTPQCDRASAEAFLPKMIRLPGVPEKITIDQSGSSTTAIKR